MRSAYREAQRSKTGSWLLYVVATPFIGPSFAFPLFLSLREGVLDRGSLA